MGKTENPGKLIENIYTGLYLKTVNGIFNFSIKIFFVLILLIVPIATISFFTDNIFVRNLIPFGLFAIFIIWGISFLIEPIFLEYEPLEIHENGIILDRRKLRFIKRNKREFLHFSNINYINYKYNNKKITSKIMIDEKQLIFETSNVENFNILIKTFNKYFGYNKLKPFKIDNEEYDEIEKRLNYYLFFLVLIPLIFTIIIVFWIFISNLGFNLIFFILLLIFFYYPLTYIFYKFLYYFDLLNKFPMPDKRFIRSHTYQCPNCFKNFQEYNTKKPLSIICPNCGIKGEIK